jgi:hypothetical protein
MSDPLHHQLLGHLLGALDDEEHQLLDARLERDEECCRQWIRWRQRLAPLEAMRPDFEPPPGLAERTCQCVAECGLAVVAESFGRRRWMSPSPVPPSRVGRIGWLDVAAVALLLLTAGAVILPAIDSSRFEARVASCQDGLRRFGVALSQYGYDQRSDLTRLASDGRLTREGAIAATLVRDGELADDGRNVCPDAWLAVQGVLREFVPALVRRKHAEHPATVVNLAAMGPQNPESQSWGILGVEHSRSDWSGTWRDGTRYGWRLSSLPAEMPLLADAPSADLPGQDSPSHGGLGRNALFEDGRVDFLPATTPADPSDELSFSADDSSAGRVSAPIMFVSGRYR